jgi:hypothetical protein
MNRQIQPSCRTLILAALALPLLSLSASAQTEPRGGALDFYGASLSSTGGNDSGGLHAFGVRGSYRFSQTWALEGAATRTESGAEGWFGDVSAKAYLVDFNHDRVEIYALAGAGFLSSAFGLDDSVHRGTVHAGLGAEIKLTGKLYLRPEVRGRWLTSSLEGDNGVAEYSLGLGWKF